MKKRVSLLAASAFLLSGLGQVAEAASLFVPGSTFTDAATNSPDTFSTTMTLAPGTTSPDGGALNLTISDIISGPDEWLVFDYQTATSGTQFVPVTSDYWSIAQTGLDLAVPANFIGAYAEFLDSSGDSIAPSNAIFTGYSMESNPVPGGVGSGVGASFVAPVPAGALPDLGASLSPFDQLDGDGVPSADVEGFYQALEFTASAAPEPAPMALFSIGILGLGLLRRFKRA